MIYTDLRDFLAKLERENELKRIQLEVDPRLEMTEICDRTLRAGGPALLFERPTGHSIPVLGNLFDGCFVFYSGTNSVLDAAVGAGAEDRL